MEEPGGRTWPKSGSGWAENEIHGLLEAGGRTTVSTALDRSRDRGAVAAAADQIDGLLQ